MKAAIFSVALLVSAALAIQDFEAVWKPKYKAPKPLSSAVGDPLYLTPLIESGAIGAAQSAARVEYPLDGLQDGEQMNSYSGFITVDASTNSHMFFWFFPATEVDPAEAPVVIWLQGGPGSSSMLGLFEINGPLSAVQDENDNTIVRPNPSSWTRKANMIYIDNPVGTGFSHTDDGFVSTQEEVGRDLYECLTQWFTLFPEYQSNDFYAFGESYAGKYVPTISKKIHDENQVQDFKINFKGLAIGNGAMSPIDSNVYGEFLYQTGMADEIERDRMFEMESTMKEYVGNEQYFNAWLTWNNEVGYFLGNMGCSYYLDIRQCDEDPEEANYNDFVDLETTRIAAHTGAIPFGAQSSQVYSYLTNDIFVSQKETIEFLLERYPVLIYNGNMDIVCHHTGTLNMIAAFETWSGKDEYYNTDREIFYGDGGEVAGYLKSVQNLRLLLVRNAGHMVPRSQPENALIMFEKFINGNL